MKTISNTILAFTLFCSIQSAAQAPVYNSYPSAQAVLFLDFDGHTVNGTSWNGSGPIECASANLDATKITEVFNRIAEDYRPFNINVTTDSTKYLAAPATKRMRAIFTTSNSWYGNNAGGVAYIGSFTWGDNTPCFIFTALFNYNVKNISEAGAHELGHTLGLRHQSSYNAVCGKVSDYHYGTGTGETSWAPIMGVGYYKNFTVWHNGSDPYGCDNTQNDLNIITSTENGFGYRSDDHNGNTNATATQAIFSSNRFNVSGVINKTDDIDVFKFKLTTTNRFQLSAVPYNVGSGNTGSDLDLQVDLVDGSQNVLGSYNPGNALNSIIDTVLSAGTYYLRVDGRGNAYASEYGSLGSYSLEASQDPMLALPLRKFELKGSAENNRHKLTWAIDADEAIVNQVVETSVNGREFEYLSSINETARTFEQQPATTGVVHYRVAVLFDNGRQHYSNTIAMRNGPGSKPQLLTNLVQNNALMMNSPANFAYSINDYHGRTIAKGTISKGASSVNISNINNGTYIIRFANEQEQYAEKFVKQ